MVKLNVTDESLQTLREVLLEACTRIAQKRSPRKQIIGLTNYNDILLFGTWEDLRGHCAMPLITIESLKNSISMTQFPITYNSDDLYQFINKVWANEAQEILNVSNKILKKELVNP